MKCKVESCDRDADYISQCVCQKHYFRMMRYGTYELTKVGRGKDRYQNGKGYQMLKIQSHPLAMKNGLVYEHRKVVFDRFGEAIPPCEKCGKHVTWKTAHIDHIDEVITNNSPENLRVLCRACNVMRSRVHIAQHTVNGRRSVTFNGETKTPTEWARDHRVRVSHTTITRRLKDGMSPEEALFAEKVTHKSVKAKERRPAYGEYQGPREQAA